MVAIRGLARELAPVFCVLVLYVAVTVAWTYPLVRHLADALPHDLGDPLFNTWLLHWNAHHIPFTSAWWNGPFFHPAPGTLALSDHLVGISLLGSPLQWLGASPVVAYNLTFLVSFVLSAFGAYLLALRVTRRQDAAFLAGLAFAFAPYRVGQLAHLQLLCSWWMPLALLGLHGYLDSRRRRWLALFAVAWLFQSLSSGYYLFFFSFLVALWILWFAPPWRRWRVAAEIGVAWLVAIAPVAASLIPYERLHTWYGLSRTFREIEDFSADLTAFLQGSPLLAHWRGLPGGVGERCLYPGVAVAVIVVASIVWRIRRRADSAATRLQWAAAGLAAVFGAAALSGAVFGSWRFTLGHLSVAVDSLHKPLGIAIVMVISALLTDRRLIEAHRRRAVFVFYAGAAVVMGILCLGPTPRIAGALFWDKAPYWWLLRLPGMTSLRVPTRCAMLAILCLAVLVALVIDEIAERARRWRWLLVAVAAAGILWDGWPQSLPMASLPGSLQLPEVSEPGAAVLELPLGGVADVAAMYRAIEHGLPVVNGYSGHDPPHYFPLRVGLARRDDDVLPVLAGDTALYVAVDRSSDERGGWERWVASQGRAVAIEQRRRWAVYRIDGGAPRSAVNSVAVPIRQIWANRNESAAAKAIDGDLATRWTTGAPQVGDEKLSVDLGSRVLVEAVVVSLGRFTTDFPRELTIEGSDDRAAWTCFWKGSTADRAVRACLEDPRTAPMRFEVGGRAARFVRLRLTAFDPVYHFSVAELAVLTVKR
jgi:hypothetical protein